MQVLKEEVRQRLQAAALREFASAGFEGTSLAKVAQRAGMATANVYRYYESKEALFDSVVPVELVKRHWRLLEASVHSLSHLTDRSAAPHGTAEGGALLDFWIEHRLAVAILLDRAQGTRHAGVAERFVKRMVAATMEELERAQPGLALSPSERLVLEQIFEGTRRCLATILFTLKDEAAIRESVEAFRRYQRAGLQNFALGLRRGAST